MKPLKPLLVPLSLLLVWQLVAWNAASPLVPGPWQVVQAAFTETPEILQQLSITLIRAAKGFALAFVLMVPLGILLGRLRLIGLLLEPLMDMLATLPPPAIVPLVMLFAGTGDGAKVTIIAYAAAVPLLLNTFEASKVQNPMTRLVARSLHLGRLQAMWSIDLPAALPMIATGIRMGVASALLVSVTAEMLLATDGIGVFLQRQQENFHIAAGLAGIVFIALAGLLVNAAVLRFERRWLFWHYRHEGEGR